MDTLESDIITKMCTHTQGVHVGAKHCQRGKRGGFLNAPRTTHTQTYIHTQTYVHTQTYIHTNTHIHTQTYIHTNTYIHTQTYIHTEGSPQGTPIPKGCNLSM